VYPKYQFELQVDEKQRNRDPLCFTSERATFDGSFKSHRTKEIEEKNGIVCLWLRTESQIWPGISQYPKFGTASSFEFCNACSCGLGSAAYPQHAADRVGGRALKYRFTRSP
jgi:hypothetical protein